MPKILNGTENVLNMLKAGGIVEQMYDTVTEILKNIGDMSEIELKDNNNIQPESVVKAINMMKHTDDLLEQDIFTNTNSITNLQKKDIELSSSVHELSSSIINLQNKDIELSNRITDNKKLIEEHYKETNSLIDGVYQRYDGPVEELIISQQIQDEKLSNLEADNRTHSADIQHIQSTIGEMENLDEDIVTTINELKEPESFNLKDNTTYGESQVAVGSGTSAGITGFYLCPGTIDQENKSFKLTNGQNDNTPLTGSKFAIALQERVWKKGYKLSINNGSKYQNYFTISKIATEVDYSFTVYVNEALPFSSTETGDLHPMDNAVYCIDAPDIGPVAFDVSAFAAGDNTRAIERGSFAEGRDTLARGQYSHAEGRKTEAAYAAHAEGYKSVASYEYSHAEGYSSAATNHSAHAEGNATTASGQYGSHAEGNGAKAIGESSHAEGSRTEASGISAHAEGGSTKAQGIFSHSEGEGTVASEPHSHAEGHGSTAKADSAHAEGYYSKALNLHSHAEGNSSEATGESSHAEGYYAKAKGNRSHAEGSQTQANGSSSHAEGSGAIANAGNSHAEGYESQATGEASHSEGYRTTSGGQGSHSEGRQTIASGAYTHAEGYLAQAKSTGSHAEGIGTIAIEECQHVEGKYNAPAGSTVHVVGWGTSDTDRKNIHTLSREGNAWYAGSVTSKDGKLASEDYVNTKIANLVNSAPETLDTLGEIAEALDNDASAVGKILTDIHSLESNIEYDIKPRLNVCESRIDNLSSIKSLDYTFTTEGHIRFEQVMRNDEIYLQCLNLSHYGPEVFEIEMVTLDVGGSTKSTMLSLDPDYQCAFVADADYVSVEIRMMNTFLNQEEPFAVQKYSKKTMIEQVQKNTEAIINLQKDDVILTSPNGTRFKLVVADDGSLSTVRV